MKDEREVLLVSDTSRWSGYAYEFLVSTFTRVAWFAWDYGTPMTRDFTDWPGTDLLFSYKADFIFPSDMLTKVRELAVNFHPSIPDYRGIGGYRYALDEQRDEFGSTCHFVTAELDGGPIIEVVRFPISPFESEESLTERTAASALSQLYRVASEISARQPIESDPNEQWGERLYTRRELDAYRRNRSVTANT